MQRSERGFTLAEMLIVVLLMGLMLAFAIPAFRSFGNSHNLKGAKEDMISQIQMARAKAISTGVDQPIHFNNNFGYNYHVHVGSVITGFLFPRGVSYATTGYATTVTMYKNGTASNSLMIPLKNNQGVRDTIAILTSGLVMSQ